MEITWNKNTSFLIKGQSVSVITDPENADFKAQIVLSSGGSAPCEDAQSDAAGRTLRIFDWPGEYETNDVPINGFSASNKPKSEDGTNQGQKTILFRFNLDGVSFCHLGELGHTLSNELIDRIGNIDVLMIKIGEDSNLDKKRALEIIESIEPRIVIPMGTSDLSAALATLGLQSPAPEPKLVIKSASSLQTEDMKYILLTQTLEG